MKHTKRTYREMQNEEANLDSGRYNADYDLMYSPPSAADTLLNAYRKAAATFGLPLGKPADNQGPAKLSDSN